MTRTYNEHMARYFEVQSQLLTFETEFLDEEDIAPAIKLTIPTSKHLLNENNLTLYRKTRVPESAIQNYLASLRRFKERITLILLEPLK